MRAKPFCISKEGGPGKRISEVKSNKGSAGIDGQTIGDFEKRLKKESLQDLESDVVGQLLSTASQDE